MQERVLNGRPFFSLVSDMRKECAELGDMGVVGIREMVKKTQAEKQIPLCPEKPSL